MLGRGGRGDPTNDFVHTEKTTVITNCYVLCIYVYVNMCMRACGLVWGGGGGGGPWMCGSVCVCVCVHEHAHITT